jgi:glycosyltransferase involved in cell wall biosynthesis
MTTAHHVHPLPGSITVIIPVRNGAETIAEQLAALAAQTYEGGWELLVADNGSTDGTHEIAEQWADRLPKLTIVDASKQPGASFARNHGAERAAGEFLAFCDADDIVVPEWLASLAAAARDYDVVTGSFDATKINPVSVQSWRPPRRKGLNGSRGFLPFAPSGNFGVWASVFDQTGGFNEEYLQSEDVEWSWRAQLASFTLGFAEGAVVHYRYRTSARAVARQGYLSGIGSVRLYRDFRSRGLKRAPITRALRTWFWLLARAPYLLSPTRRGIWVRRFGEAAGRIAGSIQLRVVFP